MNQLVIIGAGGFGREVLGWAMNSRGFRSEWEIAGFLDDRPDALNEFPDIQLPVLGGIREYQPRSTDRFVCALGKPDLRANIRDHFEDKGAVFARIIHSSCVIGRNVDLGVGVILCPGVVLTCDLAIGDNTALNVHTAAGHDVEIGKDCQISSFCDLTGHVRVGERVFMGSRASILPGIRVGARATVGAGCVVVSDVPEDVTVFGNPGKILFRKNDSD